MFTPTGGAAALYMPPSESRMVLATAAAWERVGGRLFKTFAGVVLVEAAKQVYAATPLRQVRRRPLLVPAPQNPAPIREGLSGRAALTRRRISAS
jgi:hypothetical protein